MKPYSSNLLRSVVTSKIKLSRWTKNFFISLTTAFFFFFFFEKSTVPGKNQTKQNKTKQTEVKEEKLFSPFPTRSTLAVNKSLLAYIFIRSLKDP